MTITVHNLSITNLKKQMSWLFKTGGHMDAFVYITLRT